MGLVLPRQHNHIPYRMKIQNENLASLSPWFKVKVDGTPSRAGVYEGTAVGIPEQGYTLQHGYYHWDGVRWGTFSSTPEQAEIKSLSAPFFSPENWRGVLPEADYLFKSDEDYAFHHFSGVLQRGGNQEKLVVASLEFEGSTLRLNAVRQRSIHEPEIFKCTLAREGSEFFGSTKSTVKGHTSTHADFRLSSRKVDDDTQIVTLVLNEVHTSAHIFTGTLFKVKALQAHHFRYATDI